MLVPNASVPGARRPVPRSFTVYAVVTAAVAGLALAALVGHLPWRTAPSSLFFLLAGIIQRFHFLRFGLAAVLAFVGAKMLIAERFPVPITLSLLVIAGLLAASVVASLLFPQRPDFAHIHATQELEALGLKTGELQAQRLRETIETDATKPPDGRAVG